MAVENAKLSPFTDVAGNLAASHKLLAVVRNRADSAFGEKYLFDDLVTNGSSRSPGAGHRLAPDLSVEASCSANCIALPESDTQRDGPCRFLFRRRSINPSINFKKHLS